MSSAETLVERLEPPTMKLLGDTGEPEWRQVIDLFKHQVAPFPQLRDELVVMLVWARYGVKAAAEIEALRAARDEALAALEEARGIIEAFSPLCDRGSRAMRFLAALALQPIGTQ